MICETWINNFLKNKLEFNQLSYTLVITAVFYLYYKYCFRHGYFVIAEKPYSTSIKKKLNLLSVSLCKSTVKRWAVLSFFFSFFFCFYFFLIFFLSSSFSFFFVFIFFYFFLFFSVFIFYFFLFLFFFGFLLPLWVFFCFFLCVFFF